MGIHVSLERMYALEEIHNLIYKGGNHPTKSAPESWECNKNHVFRAIYTNLAAQPAGTIVCKFCIMEKERIGYGDRNSHMRYHNVALLGPWLGYRRKNRFQCLDCLSEFRKYGCKLAVRDENMCPVCFPTGRSTVAMEIYRPLLPPNLSAFFATLRVYPPLTWLEKRACARINSALPHPG